MTNKLTDPECRASAKPVMPGDGGGLYLNVKPSGAKFWAFICKRNGKRNEMGLGAYPDVTLAKRTLILVSELEEFLMNLPKRGSSHGT